MREIPEDVLKKAASGDISSFELLYKETSCFVYNVALRVLNNSEDAEEVAQEVFVMVYRKLKYFRFESSVKTWIYRIAVNRALNLAKRRSREKMIYKEYEKESYVNKATPPRADKDKTAVETLLSGVGPDQRACIVLRNIEGLSYKEISETLKININTVRSRLSRAREKLLALKKARAV